MTVKELIEELSKHDPDKTVVDIDCYEVTEVRDDKASFEEESHVDVIRLL